MSERRKRDKIVPVRFHLDHEYPALLEAASLEGYRYPSTFLRAIALKKKSTGVPLPLVTALTALAQNATALSEIVTLCKSGELPATIEEQVLTTLAEVRAAAKRITR